MTNIDVPVFSLSRRPQEIERDDLLFREQANRAVHDQALGSPLVVMPPTAIAAAATALVMVALLCLASWLVEVPQLVKGPGIIMPGEGLIPMAAPAPGHVTAVLVKDKQRVRKGDVLVRLSGDANAAGDESHARLQLRSLERELVLRQLSEDQRQSASERRIALIDSRSLSLQQQASSLRKELQARNTNTEIAERRVRRVSQLVGGAVSADQLDSVKGSVVIARIAEHELQNRISRLNSDIEAMLTERGAEETTLQLQFLEFEVAREHLQREIHAVKLRLGRDVIAPQDAMISRVRVVAGETVQQGQPLLLLQTGGATLEAWLYVPTGSGGTIRPGQDIELRIDAFPHQIYGTQRAIVTSVSSFALHPAELRVPLAIPGPVFEVRASLVSKEVVSAGDRWPLVAGLSFQADIIQSKYRLYRWLLRHVLSPDNAAGD